MVFARISAAKSLLGIVPNILSSMEDKNITMSKRIACMALKRIK
jgi:hypothetical protein